MCIRDSFGTGPRRRRTTWRRDRTRGPTDRCGAGPTGTRRRHVRGRRAATVLAAGGRTGSQHRTGPRSSAGREGRRVPHFTAAVLRAAGRGSSRIPIDHLPAETADRTTPARSWQVNATPRVEVAQIVTRCIAGAGGVALRGAMSLDSARYHVTIVTGEGDTLLDLARPAGVTVIVEPSLVSPISPLSLI